MVGIDQMQDDLYSALNIWEVSSACLFPLTHAISESGIRSRVFASKPPARVAVIDARIDLSDLVAGWAGNFAVDSGLALPTADIPTLLRWLLDELDTLMRMDWLDDFHSELADATATLARLCEVPLAELPSRRVVDSWVAVADAVVAAASYGVVVSSRSVYRWVKAGVLPAGEVAVGVVGVRVADVVARARARDGV